MTKLCNNMLTAIITTALGEVLVTGVKAGVELEPLTAALGAGSAGNYVLSGYLPNTLFTEERAAGFALALMRKDLGLFLKAAGDAGMDLPLSRLVHRRYVAARSGGPRRGRLHQHRRALRARRGTCGCASTEVAS